jgi:tRNA-dihydrouridine synthase C
MIYPNRPAVVLAPMDGITDAPMRALQGRSGVFSYAVSEFVRVSNNILPPRVFHRMVPELLNGAKTRSGLTVQVQILGGDPDFMSQSAANACAAGATGIDINFGCPAPTVNRNDGGASLLRYPDRVRAVVRAIRQAVPSHIPVSAKLRLGWEGIDEINVNALMAEEGGASWITIHARTKVAGYQPPVFWPKIREVRSIVAIPVVANGDIWTIEDFRRCQEETGSIHFMLGRGALADPALPFQIANELGLGNHRSWDGDWFVLLNGLLDEAIALGETAKDRPLHRLKQWLKLVNKYSGFPLFHEVKSCETLEEFLHRITCIASIQIP